MQLAARHEVRNERLVCGQGQHRTGTDQEGECQQQRRGHLTGQGQGGERGAGDDQEALDRHQEAAPVEAVGEDASDQAEEHVGQVVDGLDEGDQDRGVRLADQEPLRADGLHPGGDVADEHCEPEGAKQPIAKGRPRRNGLRRIVH
jgi:hypothetical protein